MRISQREIHNAAEYVLTRNKPMRDAIRGRRSPHICGKELGR